MGSYTASRFFVILIALLFTLISTKRQHNRIRLWYPGFLFVIIFFILGAALTFIDTGSRFNQISIFSSPATQLILDEQIRENEGVPPLFTRVMHNKVVNYSRIILTNYSQYVSIDYLFLNGGNPKRMHIPNVGLFYLWQLPLVFIGLYVIIRKRSLAGIFLLAWVIILLLPASITKDEIPNVYRSLVIIFPLLIIMAIGLYELFALRLFTKLKIPLILLITTIGIWEFIYYQNQYYIHQEVHQPWYRDYAYKPLLQALESLSPHYQKIIMTKAHSGADIGVLFWSKYDPATYQAEGSPGDVSNKGFGKYLFDSRDCPLTIDDEGVVTGERGVLYINRGDCQIVSDDVKVIKTINWQDNNPAFQILEYVATPTASMK